MAGDATLISVFLSNTGQTGRLSGYEAVCLPGCASVRESGPDGQGWPVPAPWQTCVITPCFHAFIV